MVKRKIDWKWLAVIVGATVLAIAVTLGICFLREEEETLAPGFCYEQFALTSVGEESYLLSPYGDVLALSGEVPFWEQSMDGQTAIWGWEDRTFSVVSEHGIRHVNKQVGTYLDGSDKPTIYISAYGDVIYFFGEYDFNTERTELWRYNVAEDALVLVDTLMGTAFQGVVSPDGSAFAIDEITGVAGVNISIYHDNEKLGTWNIMEFYVAINFVTDDGVAFVSDATTPLQSISKDGQFVYPDLEGSVPTSVYFNEDGTEILLNLTNGGCHYYQVAQGQMQSHVQLSQDSTLTPYITEYLQQGHGDVPLESDFSAAFATTLGVPSLQQINFQDTRTGMRVKLTKEATLTYQEGSERMQGALASNGAYLMYIDQNGDYFYTDTEDVDGAYKLLWEASEYDVASVEYSTGKKSFYYVDEDGNFCYTKMGKNARICSAKKWSGVTEWLIEPATDTCYFIEDDTLYCCREGGNVVEMMDLEDVFPKDVENFSLLPDTSAGVYCIGTDAWLEKTAFCRLYADGSYHMMETE